jgi:peptidoglycan/LPS O-acetylase OafA/YrhL
MAVVLVPGGNSMAVARRILIGLAGIVAAPGVLVATAATLYIAWSIATESFYRDWFLGYGVTLMALYAVFVAGVVAIAAIAVGAVTRRRWLAIAIGIAGLLAACALEFELWDDTERVLPFGLLFGPYIAWIAAVFLLRKFPPPSQAHWADTRF